MSTVLRQRKQTPKTEPSNLLSYKKMKNKDHESKFGVELESERTLGISKMHP
jgi:hypothetical protein